MYQSIKDLYAIIERSRNANVELLKKQMQIIGEHSTTAYTRGVISGLDQSLSLLNVLLDNYENDNQLSDAEEGASDAADYLAFLKQCRP